MKICTYFQPRKVYVVPGQNPPWKIAPATLKLTLTQTLTPNQETMFLGGNCSDTVYVQGKQLNFVFNNEVIFKKIIIRKKLIR